MLITPPLQPIRKTQPLLPWSRLLPCQDRVGPLNQVATARRMLIGRLDPLGETTQRSVRIGSHYAEPCNFFINHAMLAARVRIVAKPSASLRTSPFSRPIPTFQYVEPGTIISLIRKK